MYRVLMPIDESEERTVAQAEAVGRMPGKEEIEVTLLHVFDDAVEDSAVTELPAGATARETLAESGVAVEPMARTGDAADTVLEVAEDVDADLILLGGRKRSPVGSLLFGSVSQAVILDARRPVTVTGTAVHEEPTHVCQSCGETYHAEGQEITKCRNCGGTKVEAV